MPELDLNESFIEIFTNHGIEVTADDEFIHPALPSKIKVKARANYEDINGFISSRMDMMIITETGEKIIECFGDFGSDVDAAIANNLQSFQMGVLHPILAAFGDNRQETLDQISIEEWEIDGKVWMVYIGNLIPKTNNKTPGLVPSNQFFSAIETSIRSQALNNNLHWFRSYYLQHNDKITATEFLMDNKDITARNTLFTSISITPNTEYYSCRNFILLKRKVSDLAKADNCLIR